MDVHGKQEVALSSVYASLLLTVSKLVVGLATGSLGVLSEAAHSFIDFGATLITYFAVRVSDKPADSDHPYGHGKIESIAALVETALLFITSIWIIKEAGHRLIFGAEEVKTTWYAVAVILFSIAVDWSRSRALMRMAEKTGSQALEADALHFSTDILSSIVVLAGLGFVAVGWQKADAIAALGVALFVFHAGYDMGKRTLEVLLDTAPEGVTDQAAQIARTSPGVVRVDRVRARPAGNMVFIEVAIRVSRTLDLGRVEAIKQEVANRIRLGVEKAQPLINAKPLALDSESITDTVRVVAASRSLSVHNIDVRDVGSQRFVDMELEVDDRLTIVEAHDQATSLERAIAVELGSEINIATHIEPRSIHAIEGNSVDPVALAKIEAMVHDVAVTVPAVVGVHHIRAQLGAAGICVSFHCLFDEQTSVRQAHDATVRFEGLIREKSPLLDRVLIHAEPTNHQD